MEEDEDIQVEPVFTRPNRGSRFQRSYTARKARQFIKRIKAIKIARRERLEAEQIRKAIQRKLYNEQTQRNEH